MTLRFPKGLERRRRAESLQVAEGRLELHRHGTVILRITLDEVRRVEFYKVDLGTLDDVCCDIHLTNDHVFCADEEAEGWSDAVAWLERLPGFARHWRDHVVQPPLAERRFVAFDRDPAPT